ncbi:MAG: hypothetical protein QOF02_2786 [Blastocatellia bacterium]|nr:hypothetical protein [Blastocatellia bacterium]
MLASLVIVAGVESCMAQNAAATTTAQSSVAESKSGKKIDPALLKKYVGRYELEVGLIPISTIDVTLETGELWMKPSVVKKRKLVHQSKSVFLDEVEGARYVFNKDEKGRIVSLTFPFEGESYTARRVELPAPNLKGNTTFRLKGYADANVVALAGSFNAWNQSQLICAHENDEWVCRLDLEPGIYTYKFIVDGNWTLDPVNPNTVEDEAGNVNSVIEVKVK